MKAPGDPPTIPSSLRELYTPVRDELAAVEDLLRVELTSDYPFVDLLAKHGFRLGGKRLRPALVLLSASALGNLRPEHVALAASVELIHTATLIHDDVLDEAEVRRHLDTVNARWNNEASVLLGDYLFSRSICLAASVDGEYACRAIAEAARIMCEGELRQVHNRGNYHLSEEDYLDIISEKTGALLACCCRLGAHYAGADDACCADLVGYGQQLGIAFQIADDLLDLTGEEQTAGKSLGTDLLKQKATLPIIRVLATVPEMERTSLMADLAAGQPAWSEELHDLFARHAALDYTRDKARQFTRKASDHLATLPPSPAKASLEGLCEFVISRRQ